MSIVSRASEKQAAEEQPVERVRDDPPATGMSPLTLQRYAVAGAPGDDRINVRLYIDSSDADGVRHFDERLPVSLVRAILDPEVANFFIPVEGTGRMKPARAGQHYLHTTYIREVLLLDPLPEDRGRL